MRGQTNTAQKTTRPLALLKQNLKQSSAKTYSPQAERSKRPAKATGWGIDITGRPMRYAPWPTKNFIYRAPSKKEIHAVYAASGEAVRETLLYFEECGGDTDELVRLLNDHVPGPSQRQKGTAFALSDDPELSPYQVNREMLLNGTRWYSNEYYFYFIIFTKKIIGRYDFHFGENSEAPLSQYHKIYEQGHLRFLPYGEGIKDVTNAIPYGMIKYGQNLGIEVSDFFEWADIIVEQITSVRYSTDVFPIENYKISLEFISYIYDFIRILLNQNSFVQITEKAFLGYRHESIAFMPNTLIAKALQYILYRTTTIYNLKVKMENGNSLTCIIGDSGNYDGEQLSKYRKSSFYCYNTVTIGGFKTITQRSFSLPESPELAHHSDLTQSSFTFTLRWPRQSSPFSWRGLALTNSLGLGLCYAFYALMPVAGWLSLALLPPVNAIGLLAWLWLLERQKNRQSLEKFDKITKDYENKVEDLEALSAELVREKEKLEEKVAERTKELSLANEKLLSLDRAKTEFFANVSHELRTPLTLIQAPLQALRHGRYGRQVDVGHELFQTMERNGGRLLRLINNLLDFAKIEANRLELDWQLVPLNKFWRGLIAEFESAAQSQGIELHFVSELDESASMCSDPKFLEKIGYNLLSNAVKFSKPQGRVILSLTTPIHEPEGVVLRVKDNGIGIASKDQQAIFERFAQVDATSTRKHEGTGIGLALVKEMVTILGGRVSVDSELGQGSVFEVKLVPSEFACDDLDEIIEAKQYDGIAVSQSQKKSSLITQESAGQAFGAILVVEDNLDLAQMLQSLLEPDFTIYLAANGKEGLASLEQHPVDMVISDVMMPEMDGFSMVEKIRAQPRYDGLTVIFLSAKADVPDRIRGLEGGASDYIVKPFAPRELLVKVRSHIKMIHWRRRWQKGEFNYLKDGTNSGAAPAHTPNHYPDHYNEGKEPEEPCGQANNTELSDRVRHKIEIVQCYLEENYRDDISREGLAAMVDLHPDYMSRCFSRATGQRLHHYINSLRLNQAARHLRQSEAKVVDIAVDIGLELRTFNRLFIREFGMTPAEYREAHKS